MANSERREKGAHLCRIRSHLVTVATETETTEDVIVMSAEEETNVTGEDILPTPAVHLKATTATTGEMTSVGLTTEERKGKDLDLD